MSVSKSEIHDLKLFIKFSASSLLYFKLLVLAILGITTKDIEVVAEFIPTSLPVSLLVVVSLSDGTADDTAPCSALLRSSSCVFSALESIFFTPFFSILI